MSRPRGRVIARWAQHGDVLYPRFWQYPVGGYADVKATCALFKIPSVSQVMSFTAGQYRGLRLLVDVRN